MNWKKTRITMNTWQDGDYRITENPEADGNERFRLDFLGDPDAQSEYFRGLDEAKRVASLKNELELHRQENIHLRAELDLHRQAEQFGRTQPVNHRVQCDPEAPEDDGRGIPVTPLAIAGETYDGIPDEGDAEEEFPQAAPQVDHWFDSPVSIT